MIPVNVSEVDPALIVKPCSVLSGSMVRCSVYDGNFRCAMAMDSCDFWKGSLRHLEIWKYYRSKLHFTVSKDLIVYRAPQDVEVPPQH